MQYYAQRYLPQINTLMESMPSSLLLLLKTNDCLRQLDKSVGRPVNTLTGELINYFFSFSRIFDHYYYYYYYYSCFRNIFRSNI